MITRKDNLLKRPWQQKNFEYHRQKVQSALPAIDTGPPPFRGHVAVKLKKQQKEKERCQKIEHENFLLLQRMNYITRTSRVDNTWKTPQRNLRNKVCLYNPIVPKIEDIEFEVDDEEEGNEAMKHGRKAKCPACTPTRREEINIIEERVPWEPTKKPIGRLRSQSVPARKPTIISQQESIRKKETRAKTGLPRKEKVPEGLSAKQAQPRSIILSRGSLKLSLNFPPDTLIKFQEGSNERFLMRGICHCRNAPNVRVF